MMKESICDLLLLTWNREDLLKPCMKRIFAHTELPCRLILIDNGSTDPGTLEYISRLQPPPHLKLEIVRLPENLSISKAINQGLSRVKSPWVCLLNNDILVTEGWLSEMIRVAQVNPNIGLLNPHSNQFGVVPGAGEIIDRVAQRLKPLSRQWIENMECVGFCLLLSKEVLDRVGRFDEEYEFFYFEDADYCLRVHQAGLDCAIAQGAYVYHHGGATLTTDPLKEKRFRENEERFFQKWNREKPKRVAWILYGKESASGAREKIRQQANAGHRIWVFHAPDSAPGVPRHLQVVPVSFPGILLPLVVFWRVLLKKKRFDRILIFSRGFGWCEWAGRLRGSEVLLES